MMPVEVMRGRVGLYRCLYVVKYTIYICITKTSRAFVFPCKRGTKHMLMLRRMQSEVFVNNIDIVIEVWKWGWV